jgi:hypothetical protein
MMVRTFAATALLAASAPAFAQTKVESTIPAETRRQVQIFVASLRTAVEGATEQLGERAREVVPDIQMYYQTALRVESYILPTGAGYVFVVDPPLIDASSALLWMVNRRFPKPGTAASPVRPVAGGSGATSPPEGPAVAAAPMTNPDQEYSRFTYEAVIAAMLDNALALPVADGQTLTVVVRTGESQPNPLAPAVRNLYLTFKAEDMQALRQSRITREEARARIIEKRY